MKDLISKLNKRLEDEGLTLWYFQGERYYNGCYGTNEFELITLVNSDIGTNIRLYHSELNTEPLTEDFLYNSAKCEIRRIIRELMKVNGIVREEIE